MDNPVRSEDNRRVRKGTLKSVVTFGVVRGLYATLSFPLLLHSWYTPSGVEMPGRGRLERVYYCLLFPLVS
jgi:hypothetical protein